MKMESFLDKHIDITKSDGFHLYGKLRKIESHGILVEGKTISQIWIPKIVQKGEIST